MDKYLNLKYKGLDIQVKLDDEGVIIDVFDDNDEVVATTWKTYEDFNIEQITYLK